MQYINEFKRYLTTLGYHKLTIQDRLYAVSGYLKWLKETAKQPSEYQTYLEHKPNKIYGGGLSISCIYSSLKAVELYYTYQVQMGIITINPMSSICFPKRKYAVKTVASEKEIKTIYKACNTYLESCLLSVFYGCGLRRNEAVHLDISDILFDKERVYVRKGKNYKERFVPINRRNAEILEDYIYEGRPQFYNPKATEALFISQQGTRLNGMSFANRLKAIVRATNNKTIAEKHITLHILRHSIATHLLQKNVPLESIKTFLGHSSLESTQIYTHLLKTLQHEEF